jgi:dCTP deaminase
MLLHDSALRQAIADGELVIDPFDHRRLQPSSIDLTLDQRFAVLRPEAEVLDVKQDNRSLMDHVDVLPSGYFDLHPGDFVLAATREVVAFSESLAGRVEGKSSLGRLGLLVHSTAGFVDPGFRGQITLELSNMTSVPIRLYPDMPVAQICVFQMAGVADVSYAQIGKYAGQMGPTPSMYHLNFAS